MIEVIHPGSMATIQDRGRFGFRSYGLPASGVLDLFSYLVARGLVSNEGDGPVIESFWAGLCLKFHDKALVGIGGAAREVMVNDKKRDHLAPIHIEKGDVLKIAACHNQWASYIAVYGEWKIVKVLESTSTYLPAQIGGFAGRSLKKGDFISIKNNSKSTKTRHLHNAIRPGASSRVRIMKGPEFDYMTSTGQSRLVSESFQISTQSNRTGLRLQGIRLEASSYDIPSRPVFPGTIQLTPGGPILLLNDGQTTGGYPRIGQVISADLDACGRIRPGDCIRFEMIDYEEARKASVGYQARLRSLKR